VAAKQAAGVASAREALAALVHKPVDPPPLGTRTTAEANAIAQKVREFMNAECKTKTCACCSRRRPAASVTDTLWRREKRKLRLLRAEGRSTETMPRLGLTTWKGYCLQRGVEGDRAIFRSEGLWRINLCKSCRQQLKRKKVPKESLVRVDTGSIPSHLKPLTMIEEMLLGLGRGHRSVSVMYPRGDRSLSQFCYRGHLIAFPNVGVDKIAECLPLPFKDIPKLMQVSSFGGRVKRGADITFRPFLPPNLYIFLLLFPFLRSFG